MGPDQLACQDFVELVTEYLEGTLPLADRARFEEHISACHPCAEYLDQMRTTLRLLGRLTEDTIPTQARDQLLTLFTDWKTESDPFHRQG